MTITSYHIPIQSIDKLLHRLKEVYKRPPYRPIENIQDIMFIEGQQDVINFIQKWVNDERNSTSSTSSSSCTGSEMA